MANTAQQYYQLSSQIQQQQQHLSSLSSPQLQQIPLQLPGTVLTPSTAHLANIHSNLIMHRPHSGQQQQSVYENMTATNDSQHGVDSSGGTLFNMRNACGLTSLDEMVEWNILPPLLMHQSQQYHQVFPLQQQQSAPKSPLMHKNSPSNSSISIESSSNDSSVSVRESDSPTTKRARFQMKEEETERAVEAVAAVGNNSVVLSDISNGIGDTGEINSEVGLVLENAD
jgi:hypothetical protein